MTQPIYTARVDKNGRYTIYGDGELVAEKVSRVDALLFTPELPQTVTVRLPSGETIQARLVTDPWPASGSSAPKTV